MKKKRKQEPETNSNGKKLLTTSEVAKFLDLGKSTLEQARLSGSLGIPYIRLGRLIRYRVQDVEDYLNNLPSFRHTTAEAAAKQDA